MTAGLEPVAIPAPTWWRRPGPRRGRRSADASTAPTSRPSPASTARRCSSTTSPVRSRTSARCRAPSIARASATSSGSRSRRRPTPGSCAVLRGLGAPGEPGSVGIDACSPGEVLHALANGWQPEEISHTGTNVSERDLDVLLAHPIRINLDAVSQIERLGRRAPGPDDRDPDQPGRRRRLHGAPRLRGRPADEVRRHRGPVRRRDRRQSAATGSSSTRSTSTRGRAGWATSSTGSRRRWCGRRVTSTGCSMPASRSARSTSAAASAWSARDGERPIDLEAYAAVVARHLGPYDVTAAFEPGDLVMKDAGRAAGRGRDGRAARRHDVRRPRHRLERQLLVLHLQVRAGDRPGQVAAAAAHPARHDRGPHQRGGRRVRRGLPVPRRRGGRGRRDPERRAATSRRCRRPTACGRWGPRCTWSGRRGHEHGRRDGPTSPGDACRTRWPATGSGVVLAHAGIADMRQWDPQWEALAAAPPRRPLRPPRVRPRRRRATPGSRTAPTSSR